MPVSAALLLLALLPANIQIQVRPSELPLAVSEAEYHADQSLVEFSVRNEGSVPVIAWTVGLTWHYSDGTKESGAISVDSYEQAAGLPTAPRDNRVLAPDETMRRRVTAPVRGPRGAAPYLIEMETRAVIFESNAALGDASSIEAIFSRRNDDRKAWIEILKLLKAQEAMGSGGQPMDRALDALRPHLSERTLLGVLSRSLLYRLRTGEGTALEKTQTFQDLVQQVQRHADAAERFATPSVNR